MLVLRGVHTGVVGHAQHKTAVHAGVGHGVKGVSGYVETHVLHGAGGTGAGEGCAEGYLQGYLLVGGPLAVHIGAYVPVFRGVLGDLGGGSAGVAGDQAAACLVDASGYGLVTEHERFLHDLISFRMYESFVVRKTEKPLTDTTSAKGEKQFRGTTFFRFLG